MNTCERIIAMYRDTYTVEMNRMLRTKGISQATKKQQTCAHRSTKGKRGNCELDTLVGRKAVDAARGKKVRRILRSAQDLEQHWDGGRREGGTID